MTRIAALIVAASAVFLTACGNVNLEDAAATWLDVPYARESTRQKVDIYLPRGAGPHPVIFAIHGGGFMAGSKKSGDIAPIIESGLARGYAIVSVGYRLSKEAKHPAAVDDVLAAIRFSRLNAGTYQLDEQRFAAWGPSAGGNLAAMAATKGDANAGNHVQAAVDWFGPIIFDRMDAQFKTLGIEPRLGATNSSKSPESRYLGVTVGSQEAAPHVQAASPMTYISSDDPPMFIQHGTADRHIPITQSADFAQALAAVIGPDKVVLDTLEGAGHGGQVFETDENLAKIFAFLEQHLP